MHKKRAIATLVNKRKTISAVDVHNNTRTVNLSNIRPIPINHNQQATTITITLSSPKPKTKLAVVEPVHVGLWNARSIRNKTTLITDHVLQHDMDCLLIVESWLNESDPVVVGELTPPGYRFLSVPRDSATYGGGVGILFKDDLNFQCFNVDMCFHTFEHACFTNISKDIFYFVIYRPSPSPENGLKTSDFLREFDLFIDFVNTMSSKTIIVGDFNLHVDTPSRTDVSHFLTTLDNAGFHQHVSGPTHKHGHTLDLVLSRLDDNLITSCMVGSLLSDHNVVSFNVNHQRPRPSKIKVVSRKFRSVDQHDFQVDLAAEFVTSIQCDNVNDLVDLYDMAVKAIVNKHAPVSSSVRSSRSVYPWYNGDIHHARRLRRRLERRWRKSRLDVDRQQYIDQRTITNEMIDSAKQSYYRNELDGADCKTVFKKVNGLLNKNTKALPVHDSAQDLSNDFATFFYNKVKEIYQGLGVGDDSGCYGHVSLSQRLVPCALAEFDLLSEDDVLKAISKAPTKSCTLDPVPTWFLKQNIQTFVPIITCIINESLRTGIFPHGSKHSVVTPIIKKPSLDRNILKNYRPVSGLSFVSKLIEKQAVRMVNEHMNRHNLGEQLQSAYKQAHSTETALMKVKDDITKSLSQRRGVFLVLLDLSSAFDTVSHTILLKRMESELGLKGNVLNWFKSYLSDRTSSVCIDGVFSNPLVIDFGLPQGSIVGPFGFTIYTLPLGRIIESFGLSYHMYADDIQLYTDFDPGDPISITLALNQLSCCIDAIKNWLCKNMLKLNDDKTEFLVVTSSHQKRSMLPVSLRVGDKSIKPSDNVRNLGVVFDSQMSMSAHVKSLCASLTYQLRNISRIRRFLDFDTCHLVIRALVLSRIDYGNGLLMGMKKTDVHRLQRIQNWSAKLICQALKHDHATPCLHQLHWLPVGERITFKVLVTIFKCLNHTAPDYLSTSLSLHRPARAGLRSAADTTKLVEHSIIRTLKSADSRSFFYAGPRIWNRLPVSIRESDTLSGFKKALKTYLYPNHW